MDYSYLSNIGKKRTTNQDYVKVFKNSQNVLLFLLADGMGGHQAGDVASKLTVETLGERCRILTLNLEKQLQSG